VQPSPTRCERCRFPPELCLCPVVPRLAPPCELVIVRHCSERERLTNTARWAALAVPGARILDHGLPGVTLDEDLLEAPGTYVLYPTADPAAVPSPPPLRLIVPDGTWSQSRRMLQRIPALRTLPRLALAGPPPGLRLRRPHRRDGMSTTEAIAGAFATLGAPAEAEALLDLHAAAVERVLRLKGEWHARVADAARLRTLS
jgi:DTW domain-containing protein